MAAMRCALWPRSLKRAKKPPPAPQEEEDASPARGPLPDDSADAGHNNKRAVTPKRGKKRPRQGDERPEKRAAAPDAVTVAASALKRKKKKSKRAADKDRRKKKKKKQLTRALTTKPPQLLELESGLNDNREHHGREMMAEQEHAGGQHDKGMHGIHQEEQQEKEVANQEHADDTSLAPPPSARLNLRSDPERTTFWGVELKPIEPYTLEPSGRRRLRITQAPNTSPPQDERRAREEEQQEKKIAELDHAGGTSPPHDKDMHGTHGEEQQEEDVANQEHADDTSPSPSPQKDNHSVDEEEQPKDTSPLQEKNRDQEDEETGAQVNGKALQFRNAPSTKLRGSETEKKPAVERSWSYNDELKILNALVEHAQFHDGAMPDSSLLLANLTFDKIDANEDKLTDKIRKLRTRYRKMLSQGYPSDRLARRLFKLSEKLWGQVDEDEQLEPATRVYPHFEPTSRDDFSALSKLYPHLAKEVKAYAKAHSSRDLIMAMFMNIGHEKARELDAKCKKLQIEAFKLEFGQASLINELLFAISGLTRVKF